MFKWFKKFFTKKSKKQNQFITPVIKNIDEYNPSVRRLILNPSDLNEFAKTLEFDNNIDLEIYNFSSLSKEAKLKIREIILEDYKKITCKQQQVL